MRRLRDDSGLAVVTAIMAGLVLLAMSVAGVTLATHSLDQSAGDRRRVQAIHAAEAGIDRFLYYLETAPLTGTACSLGPQTLDTSPAATFNVTATYYADVNAPGAPMACPPASTPAAVLIRSVGTSAGTNRTMEAWVGLTTVTTSNGSPLSQGAVFARDQATWTGAASIGGNPDDADLYTNGNLTLNGGGTIYGNVDARGTVSLGGATEVKRNVTSLAALSIGNNSIVRGNARSSTAGVSSGGTIGGSAYYCTGSAPGGTVSGSKVKECPSPPPPAERTFPTFTYDPAKWIADGYQIQSYTGAGACTAANTFIRNTIADGQNWVVRINDGCTLSFTGVPKAIPVRGNLAIISNGPLFASGGANFEAVPSGASHKLHLMFTINSTVGCTTSGVTFSGTSSTGTNDTLIYSPCVVEFTGGAFSLEGQIFGARVHFTSTSNITYRTVNVPGNSTTTVGWTQSMRYRREVTN